MRDRRRGLLLALAALSALPSMAWAQSQANLPLVVAQSAGGTSYSVPI